MGKVVKYIAGVVAAAAIGLGVGTVCREKLLDAEAYVLYHTDNYVKSHPTLDSIMETLAYPGKEMQKKLNGWSEQEYQDNYQRCRSDFERTLNIENGTNTRTD